MANNLRNLPDQNLVHDVDELHDVILVVAAKLEGYSLACDRLLSSSPRMTRSKNVPIEHMDWDDNSVWCEAKGSTGDHYQVRINLYPKQTHRCTCPDWHNNVTRSVKIPCKHVIALANRWKNFHLAPRLSQLTLVLHDAKQALSSKDPRQLSSSYRMLSRLAREDDLPK